MAALQSMTLQERMNKINNDELHEYTFQEACNKFLSDVSPIGGTTYAVNYNKYTAQEAIAIIREQSDLHSKDITELLNEMGSTHDSDVAANATHLYTATEALNKKGALVSDGNYISLVSVNWTDVGDVNWSDWNEVTDS